MKHIVITGGTNGIGKAIIEAMAGDDVQIWNLDIMEPVFANGKYPGRAEYLFTDISNYEDVLYSLKVIPKVDILINNAGINFIDWLENTTDDVFDRIVGVNARGIFNTAKVFIDKLIESKGTILNIVSNASHMPMTNSIAYNASKGAAHIMTLQLARELGPKGVTVFGISPNRVGGTIMSKYIDEKVCGLRNWTLEYAREYQLKALPAGEETDADTLAEFIAFILSTKQRHKYMAGTILPYGK